MLGRRDPAPFIWEIGQHGKLDLAGRHQALGGEHQLFEKIRFAAALVADNQHRPGLGVAQVQHERQVVAGETEQERIRRQGLEQLPGVERLHFGHGAGTNPGSNFAQGTEGQGILVAVWHLLPFLEHLFYYTTISRLRKPLLLQLDYFLGTSPFTKTCHAER
jgi:hypothetical protein